MHSYLANAIMRYKIRTEDLCWNFGFLLILIFSALLVFNNKGGQAEKTRYELYFSVNHYSHLTRTLEGFAILDILLTRELIKLNRDNSPPMDKATLGFNEAYINDFKDGSRELSPHFLNESCPPYELNLAAFSTSPVLVFRLIHRLAHFFPEVNSDYFRTKNLFAAIHKQDERDLLDILFHNSSLTPWPNQDDLDNLIDNILRLHHIHGLGVGQFSEGKVPGSSQKQGILRSSHMFEIAEFAKMNEFWTLGHDWFSAAGEKALNEKMDQIIVRGKMQELIKNHDEGLNRSNPKYDARNPWFFTKRIASVSNDGLLVKRKDRWYKSCIDDEDKNSCAVSDARYWALCQGKELQSEFEKSLLFCWLERKMHAALLIGPMKMEFLSRDPEIVQIYDFLSPSTIDAMENTVREKEARIRKKTPYDPWLLDQAERLTIKSFIKPKNVAMVTGLKIPENDQPLENRFAIHTHSIFGSYSSSAKVVSLFETKNKTSYGEESIATFRIHLSQVGFGGKTTFRNNIAASPIKGSALFYYNVKGDGQSDPRTRRWADDCPVIGIKKVATEFIKLSDQLLVQQCPLFPGQRYRIKANGVLLPQKPQTEQDDEDFEILPESDEDQQNPNEGNGTSNSPFNNNGEILRTPIPGVPEESVKKFTYSSARDLKNAVVIERDIYKFIRDLFPSPENWTSVIKAADGDTEIIPFILQIQSYLNDYEETSLKIFKMHNVSIDKDEDFSKNQDALELISWNILASYRMLWRFSNYINVFIHDEHNIHPRNFTPAPVKEIVQFLRNKFVIEDWPDAIAVQESMMGIIQLQYIYDFAPAEMAQGLISDIDTGVKLHPIHCLQIGKHAVATEDYLCGVEWLETAVLELVKLHAANAPSRPVFGPTLTMTEALVELRKAKQIHDKRHQESQGWEPNFYDQLLEYTDFHHLNRISRKDIQYGAFRGRELTNFANINFWGICNGRDWELQRKDVKKKLFCWLETEIHPYWKINPLRAEIHSMYPAKLEVVQFHNILSDRRIEFLKERVSLNLTKSSTVITSDDDSSDNSKLRLSANSWVDDDEAVEGRTVTLLAGMATGLKTLGQFVDELQVAAYTPGSHYTVHPDAGDPTDQLTGTSGRLATFLFYLSDVVKGGITAFVQCGVGVKPEKGSAVFWYNLNSDGSLNNFTWHGSCPLIHGEKWVANKWIHYLNQTDMTCDLRPSRPIEILVNGKSKYRRQNIANLDNMYLP